MERARKWGEHRYRRYPFFVILVFVLGGMQSLQAPAVDGHGFMLDPKPRALDHLQGDRRGWPIAGSRLRREPCLGIKFNKRFAEVKPGPMQLALQFNDGANHVGPCYAYLFDPKNPENKLKIGEMMDCARSDHPGPGQKGQTILGHMPVTIPNEVPCDPEHCVLQWVWIGTHLSATNPEAYEYYDNCADLKITGAQEGIANAVPHEEHKRAEPILAPALRLERRASRPPQWPSLAWQQDMTTAQGYVRHMITYALSNGGGGNETAILTMKRRIEALELQRHLAPTGQLAARADNARGVTSLRVGQVREAVQAFQSAYQGDPTDAEIINNLGYAYLRQNDPQAAEPWLLLALVYAPGRTNAWVNLGQSYAKQGRHREAVACFSIGYRFSANQNVTRRFFQKMAEGEDDELREIARQTLQLQLLQAAKHEGEREFN